MYPFSQCSSRSSGTSGSASQCSQSLLTKMDPWMLEFLRNSMGNNGSSGESAKIRSKPSTQECGVSRLSDNDLKNAANTNEMFQGTKDSGKCSLLFTQESTSQPLAKESRMKRKWNWDENSDKENNSRKRAVNRCTEDEEAETIAFIESNLYIELDGFNNIGVVMSQLLWATDFWKSNFSKTTKEIALKLANHICGGIRDIIKGTEKEEISDNQLKQILKITREVISQIQLCIKDNFRVTIRDIQDKAEHLMETYLDFLSCENLDTCEQWYRYSVCSTLVVNITEVTTKKLFLKKLMLKFASGILKLWKAFCQRQDSSDTFRLEVVDIGAVNVLFFYCQLLEAVITTNLETQPWIEYSFYKQFLSISENAENLFIMFPNLAYVLCGVMRSIKLQLKKSDSNSTSSCILSVTNLIRQNSKI